MVTGIILAAGNSSRMGTNKLLIKISGKSILLHTVESALNSNLDNLIVVTGHQSSQITKLLHGLPVRVVYNPHYAKGQSTSVIKGVQHVGSKAQGFMFILGDQPFLTLKTINHLINCFCETKDDSPIIVPYCKGKRGNPVIFHKTFLPEIKKLKGDEGARSIIKNNTDKINKVEIESEEIITDIDTPKDLQKFRG